MTDDLTYSTLLSSGMQPPGSQPDSLGALRRLGQYRIIKQLGHGGMGVVYQAEDTHLNRLAALKVMRADYAADMGARARFIREAQAAAQLKHDHIVTIYQVGEENDVPFLAMEFLTGKSLEDWLRPDRRATVIEALLISKQVARGLSAAHAANLIHRDIKPANLWLEAPRGRVKILDFGLARYSGAENPVLTQDGSVIGTPAFMAPEQARGNIVDHRCDLFSLGCVMYRMLTGRLPFQGNTLYAVLTAIASETPPSPAIVRPETPQLLSDLVDQLLAKNPDHRPASAQQVLEELVAIEQQMKQPPSPQSLLGSLPVPAADTESPAAVFPSRMPPATQPHLIVRRKGPQITLSRMLLSLGTILVLGAATVYFLQTPQVATTEGRILGEFSLDTAQQRDESAAASPTAARNAGGTSRANELPGGQDDTLVPGEWMPLLATPAQFQQWEVARGQENNVSFAGNELRMVAKDPKREVYMLRYLKATGFIVHAEHRKDGFLAGFGLRLDDVNYADLHFQPHELWYWNEGKPSKKLTTTADKPGVGKTTWGLFDYVVVDGRYTAYSHGEELFSRKIEDAKLTRLSVHCRGGTVNWRNVAIMELTPEQIEEVRAGRLPTYVGPIPATSLSPK